MARTIPEIQAEISAYKAGRTELDILNSLSSTAIWRAWIYIQSLLIYTIENMFDAHRSDIGALIDEKKPHRTRWYRNKVLDFQFGQALVIDSDVYDNSGLSDDEITAKKVVKYAAAIETGDQLVIKVAGENSGDKIPLPADQEAALNAYIAEIKDAGVHFTLVNRDADYYRATIDIYYDPMILDGNGNRLDGTVAAPVTNAIKNYISNLPFNGEYSNMALTDILQEVVGVVIPELKLAETKFGLNDWTPINAKVTPDSGYMKVYDEADLTLNWIAYETAN